MEQLWSTAAVPESRKFTHWREVVCQAFTRLSPERVASGVCPSFEGEIRLRPLGAGSVSSIRSAAQRVSRTRNDIAETPCDSVFLNVQAEGWSVVRQGEGLARMAAGSFALVDATRPFAMDFEGPFRHVSVHMPRPLMIARLGDLDAHLGRPVAPGDDLGGIVLAYLSGLLSAKEGMNGAQGRALMANLADLLAIALRREAPAPPRLADRHLDIIRRHAERELADPALSVERVARHFRITPRQIHKLFARDGDSFGRWLLARRLERCQAALADPALADRAIGEIAFDNGFADASHFARRFKQRFGATPRDWRREALWAAWKPGKENS